MSKLKTFINKHDNIFVFLLLLVISVGFVFRNVILGFDSLYVFGNLYKLSQGFIIYEEVNIITFPLFYEIFRVLLSLFGNYLGFLILNFLIVAPLYFTIYQILKACKVKKIFALLFTVTTIFITNNTVLYGPSYNTFALLLYLVGLAIYLRKKDSKFSFIIQGVFAFLTLLCNQKFGAAYIGSLFLLHLFNIKSDKKSIFTLLKTYSITLLLFGLFLLLLLLTNRFNSFIDMTILNMGSFSNNYSIDTLQICFLIAIFTFYIFPLICIEKKFNNYTALKPLLSFTFPLLIITYPILNGYHFDVFFTLFFVLVFYTIYNMLYTTIEKSFNTKIIDRITCFITFVFSIFLIVHSVMQFISWNANCIKTPGDIFYGAVLAEDIKEPIREASEYIERLKAENKNYRVLSHNAMFYTLYDVPEKNNSLFDLPLRGNLGKSDWHTLETILNNEPDGTYIIIDRKFDGEFRIYQFPEEIFNYVNENYQYVEDIGHYSVYQK